MKKGTAKDRKSLVPAERIETAILLIRGQKVMLDHDLADLYGVGTKVLKQAVKRNIDRFPPDFMFVLTREEFSNLRSQIVTSSSSQWGGPRYESMVFKEQGVAMLSSVLRSKRAVQVNIEIMRAFVRQRQMLSAHKDLERKLAALERKHDDQFKIVFEAIAELMTPPEKPRKRIDFEIKEGRASYSKSSKRKSK